MSHDLLNLWNALSENASSNTLADRLKSWAQPPGTTEKEKCERAERMVGKAIAADERLSQMNISIFAKGSYANRTNIPSDSDVDVAIRANNYYLNFYPEGLTDKDLGFVPSAYLYEHFKNDVATAILNYFGDDGVTIGNKAIEIHANTVRVDADAVPHMIHRRYNSDRSFNEGVALKTLDGGTIYNWPEQDYTNGVAKNDRTGKRYKAAVRILKNLRSEMKNAGVPSADSAASYLLACLAYNVPDHFFSADDYVQMMENCLSFIAAATGDRNATTTWTEVNGLKYLFGDHQGWDLMQVHGFSIDALKFFRGLKQ